MERSLSEAGVEPENRPRTRKVIETLKRVAGFRTFSVTNVGESPDLIVKLHEPDRPLTARRTFGPLTRECGGSVRDAVVVFPRSGLDAPLEMSVSILKEGRRGIERYAPAGSVETFLIERLREASGGRDRMPRALLVALKGLAADVIGYCKPSLDLRVSHAPGSARCVATFVGARECSLAFLEYAFEKHGRRLVDVELRSAGTERAIVLEIDADREGLPSFPRRKEERAPEEQNKRLKTESS